MTEQLIPVRAKSFFDLTEIEINVSYPGLGLTEPMKFFLRPMMSKEQRDLQTSYFGLSVEEQEAKKDEQNIKMLSSLTVKQPRNVPDFDRETVAGDDLKSAIFKFFNDGNGLKAKVCEDVLTLYFRKIQPAELYK